MGNECVKSKLSPCALGVAFGILKGICLMLIAWISLYWGYGTPMIEHVAQVYHGYSPTIMGGLIGGAYGLIGGFIFGVIFGWIYNFCLCCCQKKCDKA